MSRSYIGVCSLLIGAIPLLACEDGNVKTQHNDVGRTGAYLAETTLTPQTVRDRGMREKYRLVRCNQARSFDDTRPVQPPRPQPARDTVPCLNGPIITQPLYVRNVDFRTKNETANGVFVATQWDWVHAVNAQTGAWEWATNLMLDNNGAFVQPPCQWRDGKCGNGWLARGVNSTPVIDAGANKMYVLFSTRLQLDIPVNCTTAGGARFDQGLCRYLHHLTDEADVNYWLVVLDIRTGVELNRVRVGTMAKARKSDGSWLAFDDRQQLDRPGLLLDRGFLYIAFGADAAIEGHAHFHGWVMKYRADDLAFQAAFCTSPNSPRASGIWQGGGGLAADGQGRVYFLTGNGPAPAPIGVPAMLQPLNPHPANSFGDSFVKLTSSGATLSPQAFVPDGANILETNDADFGSGGTMVIPNTNLVIGGGKTGYLYLLNRDSMMLEQSFAAATNLYKPSWRDQCWNGGPHLHGAPTFWNDNLYVWGEKDVLKLYKFDRRINKFPESVLKADDIVQNASELAGLVTAAGTPSTGGPGTGAPGGGSASTGPTAATSNIGCPGPTALNPVLPRVFPAFKGTIRALPETMPGGMLSVSANGTRTRSGVVWATLPVGDWPTSGPFPGRLYAFDADNLAWLWDTGWGGALGHWVPPTIAEGQVYLATNEYLLAYGLCSADQPCRPTGRPSEPKTQCVACHNQGRMLEILHAMPMTEVFPNGAAMRAFAAAAFKELALPDTHAKVLELEGQGVQTFEARPDPEGRGKFVWWPTVSTADLVGTNPSTTERSATTRVRLSEGFVWSASDGSAAVGDIEKTTLAPESTAAPWTLFKVRPSGDQGVLSKLRFVQRVHTHAGHAPASPPERLGQRAQVAFYAQYWFYE